MCRLQYSLKISMSEDAKKAEQAMNNETENSDFSDKTLSIHARNSQAAQHAVSGAFPETEDFQPKLAFDESGKMPEPRSVYRYLCDLGLVDKRGIERRDSPVEIARQFEAALIWLHESIGVSGRTYEICFAGQQAGVSITAIKYRINVTNLAHEPCQQLTKHSVAVCSLALSELLPPDRHNIQEASGNFVLLDKLTHAAVAAGVVRHDLRRARNLHSQAFNIAKEDRERLNGHKGKVIWFTGLSGSGKSTLANALEKALHAQDKRTYILDGDNIRQGLNKDLGFTDADRAENIRRVAEVARLMMDAGLIVMAAFISPFRQEREMARRLIGEDNFVEVYVDTPLEICEQRDPKGLYKKARSGEIPNMTGINSLYETPSRPDLVIEGNAESILNAVEKLMKFCLERIN
jgi:bifunctional enzyme CysN/CysC